eukprot:338889-Prorocentrum_minimum.AAC.1
MSFETRKPGDEQAELRKHKRMHSTHAKNTVPKQTTGKTKQRTYESPPPARVGGPKTRTKQQTAQKTRTKFALLSLLTVLTVVIEACSGHHFLVGGIPKPGKRKYDGSDLSRQ